METSRVKGLRPKVTIIISSKSTNNFVKSSGIQESDYLGV